MTAQPQDTATILAAVNDEEVDAWLSRSGMLTLVHRADSHHAYQIVLTDAGTEALRKLLNLRFEAGRPVEASRPADRPQDARQPPATSLTRTPPDGQQGDGPAPGPDTLIVLTIATTSGSPEAAQVLQGIGQLAQSLPVRVVDLHRITLR